MAYNEKLADKVREALQDLNNVEEKKMFRGLTFMINDKMCVSVSGDRLMCRFDPELQENVEGRKGFEPMVMKGHAYKGFCYVNEIGFKKKKDFEFWINLCLQFNAKAKSSKKIKKAKA